MNNFDEIHSNDENDGMRRVVMMTKMMRVMVAMAMMIV